MCLERPENILRCMRHCIRTEKKKCDKTRQKYLDEISDLNFGGKSSQMQDKNYLKRRKKEADKDQSDRL